MRSRRSLKVSHTQTSVPQGTLNYGKPYIFVVTEILLKNMAGEHTLAEPLG